MRLARSAKIVATPWPATSDEASILAVFGRGVGVFKLDFSHRHAGRPCAPAGNIPHVPKQVAPRCPARPAGAEAAARHIHGRSGAVGIRCLVSPRHEQDDRRYHPGHRSGTRRSSPRFEQLPNCCSTTESCASRSSATVSTSPTRLSSSSARHGQARNAGGPRATRRDRRLGAIELTIGRSRFLLAS